MGAGKKKSPSVTVVVASVCQTVVHSAQGQMSAVAMYDAISIHTPPGHPHVGGGPLFTAPCFLLFGIACPTQRAVRLGLEHQPPSGPAMPLPSVNAQGAPWERHFLATSIQGVHLTPGIHWFIGRVDGAEVARFPLSVRYVAPLGQASGSTN